MNYTGKYTSPLGEMLIASDDTGITGVWFSGQKYYASNLGEKEEKETPAITQAKKWLDIYFSGEEPPFSLPIHLVGTAFQKEVWQILRTIPYGKTVTYGEIAKTLAERKGIPHMSAQAVGSAVGHNPISVIIPCHRVLGTNGNLTDYAGGLDKKEALLKLEINR